MNSTEEGGGQAEQDSGHSRESGRDHSIVRTPVQCPVQCRPPHAPSPRSHAPCGLSCPLGFPASGESGHICRGGVREEVLLWPPAPPAMVDQVP